MQDSMRDYCCALYDLVHTTWRGGPLSALCLQSARTVERERRKRLDTLKHTHPPPTRNYTQVLATLPMPPFCFFHPANSLCAPLTACAGDCGCYFAAQ